MQYNGCLLWYNAFGDLLFNMFIQHRASGLALCEEKSEGEESRVRMPNSRVEPKAPSKNDVPNEPFMTTQNYAAAIRELDLCS